MDFIKDLFTSETESEQTTASRRDPYSAAQPYFDDMIQYAGEQGLQQQTPFDQDNFLRFNQGQRGALQNQYGAAGGYNQGIINPAMGAWQSSIAGPDQAVFDRQLDAYSGKVKQNFDRFTMPGINDMFTGAGGRDSSREAIAGGIAQGDAAESIARYGAGLENQYQDRAIQDRQFAMNQTGNLMNWGMQPGNLQYQTATALRGDEQNQLNQERYNWDFNQNQGVWGNFNQAFPNVFNAASTFGENTGEQYGRSTSTEAIGSTLINAAVGAYTGYAAGGGGGGGAPVNANVGGSIGNQSFNQLPNPGYSGNYGYYGGQAYPYA